MLLPPLRLSSLTAYASGPATCCRPHRESFAQNECSAAWSQGDELSKNFVQRKTTTKERRLERNTGVRSFGREGFRGGERLDGGNNCNYRTKSFIDQDKNIPTSARSLFFFQVRALLPVACSACSQFHLKIRIGNIFYRHSQCREQYVAHYTTRGSQASEIRNPPPIRVEQSDTYARDFPRFRMQLW